MKVIVAGSRTIKDYNIVKWFIEKQGLTITEVVSGKCKDGVDAHGEQWAKENGIPIKPFPANWKDLSHPKAVIKEGRYGKYDASAGPRRNRDMAIYGDSLIVLIHNESSGSEDMIGHMKEFGKPIFSLHISSGSKGQDLVEGMACIMKEEKFNVN